jgi:hypothetical protein
MPLGVTKTWSRYVWLIARDKPVAASQYRTGGVRLGLCHRGKRSNVGSASP